MPLPRLAPLFCLLLAMGSPVQADIPVVETATATQVAERWRVTVTLSHPDTGWDHYADGWEVLDPNGKVLGFRLLAHPHVQEQPFSRSLTLDLPDGVRELRIRARCSRDGPAPTDQLFILPLPLPR